MCMHAKSLSVFMYLRVLKVILQITMNLSLLFLLRYVTHVKIKINSLGQEVYTYHYIEHSLEHKCSKHREKIILLMNR